jgi:hypothetical protein
MVVLSVKQANPYPLRLEEILSRKLRQLSKENNRSYNKEIEWILKKYIEQYEADHSEIILTDSES